MSKEDLESQIDSLQRPEFRTELPPAIRSRLSSEELWLFQQIDELNKAKDWTVSTLITLQNIHLRRQEKLIQQLNDKIRSLEETKIQGLLDWKLMLASKLGIAYMLLTATVSAVLAALAKFLLSKVTGD